MTQVVDVAIVGAGAAGLMAGIEAGRAVPGLRIVALDGAPRIGAKILISGGGRCNVTHDVVEPADYNGSSRNAIARVLRTYPVDRTVEFFAGRGVRLKREETGKLFPVTDRARDVLDALLGAAGDAGVDVRVGHRVTAIHREREHFLLEITNRPSLRARRVVLATGGRSVPKTGSDGAGYEMARSLGHSVTHLWPALVPLLLPTGHWLTEMRGITIEAALELRSPTGRRLRREQGSLLFTHVGLSGPVVLDMSRHWLEARRGGAATLHLSLYPDMTPEAAEAWLLAEASSHPRGSPVGALARTLPGRLAEAVVHATVDVDVPSLGRLRKDQRRRLVRAMTGLELPVTGDRGFAVAEVTAGGVPLEELDISTMASRICDGLYLCGEICDVDGRIGGYNFQWAWASGALAGEAAARSIPVTRSSDGD